MTSKTSQMMYETSSIERMTYIHQSGRTTRLLVVQQHQRQLLQMVSRRIEEGKTMNLKALQTTLYRDELVLGSRTKMLGKRIPDHGRNHSVCVHSWRKTLVVDLCFRHQFCISSLYTLNLRFQRRCAWLGFNTGDTHIIMNSIVIQDGWHER